MSSFDVASLLEAGFEMDDNGRSRAQEEADRLGMSDTQPYNVLAVLVKGVVEVVIERNTAAESAGGLDMVVTYPPVAKISSPNGATTCSATDVTLIAYLADELG